MSDPPPPGPPPQQQQQQQQDQHGVVQQDQPQQYQAHNQPLPAQQQQQHRHQSAPALPPRRRSTEQLMPQGHERTEQMETMQWYEAKRPQSEEDRDQETLQREFPGLDSSLIAAIYGDCGSLSATRGILGELTRGDE